MLQVNKYVKASIVFSAILIILLLSSWVTGLISENGYSIDEVDAWVATETAPVSDVNAESALKESIPKAIKDLNHLDKSGLKDSEYAVQCALSILIHSPLASDVVGSEYEVKLIDGWVVRFCCNSYDVYVNVDSIYYQPISFTFTRNFTDEERMYFFSLGHATEVQNEDGTNTIYYI